jgi:hypothetical protein
MTDNRSSQKAPEPLDELVHELLECGAVLSQMISRMVEFEASGRGAPDAAPIPEIAHFLIRDVSKHLRHQYSRRDLRIAAKLVNQVTEAICSDIYYVPPEAFDRILAEEALDD